ncbi:hypothetical protein JW921_11510, partial [Candidatus Fermentibacterales bacterium]|nr:hypothetical protein [Candidatus Fermentibacterales bacterium]
MSADWEMMVRPEKSRLIAPVVLAALAAVCLPLSASAQHGPVYSVLSEFGDFVSCDTLAQGIVVVWWDKGNDLSARAAALLDSMAAYRQYCLDSLDMQDPPNPGDGYYYNVYIHETGDVFPDGWACGQGTDMYGYPYMTLPIGTVLGGDWMTISHEAFHVFQYSGDAPGFEDPDAWWYIEASANWFAAVNYPVDPCAFVESRSLVHLPHVSMWLGYDNFPEYYPENWQRYVHQYAMALFLFYLTEEIGAPYSYICGCFYNGDGGGQSSSLPQDLLPQEYLYAALGGDQMRTCFTDWAAHMTNDFDFLLPSQKEMAQEHWDTYADPADDNEFVLVLEDSGTGGWYRPPDSLTTTGWSFNTYRIRNGSTGTYSFHLLGDLFGSEADPACFRGAVLVKSVLAIPQFRDLEMISNTEGSLTLEVTAADTSLYLLVVSVPGTFTDVEQLFGYEVSIEKGPAGSESTCPGPEAPRLARCIPNPFHHQTKIEFEVPTAGPARLAIYDARGRLVSILLE